MRARTLANSRSITVTDYPTWVANQETNMDEHVELRVKNAGESALEPRASHGKQL